MLLSKEGRDQASWTSPVTLKVFNESVLEQSGGTGHSEKGLDYRCVLKVSTGFSDALEGRCDRKLESYALCQRICVEPPGEQNCDFRR